MPESGPFSQKEFQKQSLKPKSKTSQHEKLKQSVVWLRQTVSQITALNIPANPENYSLWYDYFSGRKPALKDELDKRLKAKSPFTDDVNHELYFRFFVEGAERQLADIRNAIRSLIEQLGGQLGEITEGMDGYDQLLVSCEAQMEKDQDVEALNQMVNTLLKETRHTRESNQQSLKNISKLNSEINEMKHCLEKLSEEVLEDALTGVANRRALDLELKTVLDEGCKKSEYCLLLLDIDRFKLVNDEHGHLIGDRVLRFVAQMIKESVKGGDFVARYGGEEFAVIFPNTSYQGGLAVARTIIQTVAKRRLTLNKEGRKLGRITLSGGLSLVRASDTADSLIERADTCMYKAKSNGRNTVVGTDI